ncbi:MAG: hypothetical protein VKJ04_07535 [Vampirovibrionales bacterium]|nr:hypothetical protein [Vampirovibrionales bacterium]
MNKFLNASLLSKGLLAFCALAVTTSVVMAQPAPTSTPLTQEQRQAKHQEMREKFKNMTPEQKAEWKAEKKARFEALPPEKQAEIKARHEQHKSKREAWKNMTPEQR